MMQIESPGLLTSIQDLGRFGFQHMGINTSGAMDSFAARVANVLVGNAESEALLEVTMLGPKIHFKNAAIVGVTGAEIVCLLDGIAMSRGKPINIRAGQTLIMKTVKRGCRAYLAVRGGFDIPQIMGSASTHLLAGFGGFKGRALKAGDELQTKYTNKTAKIFTCRWSTSLGDIVHRQDPVSDFKQDEDVVHNLYMLQGTGWSPLDEQAKAQTLQQVFSVHQNSNRMGVRLSESIALSAPLPQQLSAAVKFGTVQMPPSGQPIILGVDRQTTGGYPVFGHLASISYSTLAQLKPGDRCRLHLITLSDADRLWAQREREFARFKSAVYAWWQTR